MSEAAPARPWTALYPPRAATPEAPATTVLDNFRATVLARPEAPALHFEATTVTRASVDRRSDQLAAELHRRGARAGDRVAVALQNTPDAVITVLATWKLACTVVLVNPMYRERELAHLLNDSGARMLIADAAMRPTVDALPPAATPTFVAYADGGLDCGDGAEGAAAPDVPAPTADDIALLTYTSGTTGRSKGAVTKHSNVSHVVASCRDWIGLGDDDAILAVAPMFHITGFVMHLALGVGVGLPIVLTGRFDPAAIGALVERYRPTFTIGSITAFIAMLNEPAVRERDLGSLRAVLSGGAAVSAAVVDRYERELGAYIHNAYGLTETTSAAIAVPLGTRAPVDPASGALSIGVPLPGTDVRIRDDDGAQLAPGEVGEICIEGPGVAAGYWGKPDESRRAFGDGELRTGDVGFMDVDGWVFVVDRKKDLIVASGYKVWPREVEDVLYEHPAVREAAVVGAPDDYRGETVHAHVSLDRGASAETAELRAFCRERLASYKCPTRIFVLEELPKTATGKILRRELRERAG